MNDASERARGHVEAAVERSRAHAERGELQQAIDELQHAARELRKPGGDSQVAHALLWPAMTTLARRLDEAGDRGLALELAAQAEDEAIRSRSAEARRLTRALVADLSLRRRTAQGSTNPIRPASTADSAVSSGIVSSGKPTKTP